MGNRARGYGADIDSECDDMKYKLNSRESKTFQNEHAAATWSQDSVAVGRQPTVRAYESPPYAWTCGQCGKPIDHERFLCAECAIDNDRSFDRARQRVKAILLARWAEPAQRLHAEYDQAQSVIQEHASSKADNWLLDMTRREEGDVRDVNGKTFTWKEGRWIELLGYEAIGMNEWRVTTEDGEFIFSCPDPRHAGTWRPAPPQCPACGSRTGCDHIRTLCG